MLPAMAKRRLGLADKLARVFPDHRDRYVLCPLVAIAIGCGYEDAKRPRLSAVRFGVQASLGKKSRTITHEPPSDVKNDLAPVIRSGQSFSIVSASLRPG